MNTKPLAICIAGILGTFGTSIVAPAQEAEIEEVFVTGSRIKRADIVGALFASALVVFRR